MDLPLMSRLFLTGTGTGVGKTLVTTILCHQLRSLGRRVQALKPVVSGFSDDDPESDPALILRSLDRAVTPAALDEISPWRFAAPISPHLAARREGRKVFMEEIRRFCLQGTSEQETIRLIEGAGGLFSPICEDATCARLIAALGDPVVLVAGTYLGSISHTLTALGCLTVLNIPIRAIIVSESAESAGLVETMESLREFGAAGTPILPLPRLSGTIEDQWRAAPSLAHLREIDHA